LSCTFNISRLASNRTRRIRNSSYRAQLTFGFGAVAVSYFINTLVINECALDSAGCGGGSLLANTSGEFLSGGARGRTGVARVRHLTRIAPLASGGCGTSSRNRSRTAARRTREESKITRRLGCITTGGDCISASGSRSIAGIFPITSVI